MNPDTKPPTADPARAGDPGRDSAATVEPVKIQRHRDDSFTDLDKLDRPELDDEDAEWENETGVRRVQKTKPTPPTKLAGCA